jgi:hypothetical protein
MIIATAKGKNPSSGPNLLQIGYRTGRNAKNNPSRKRKKPPEKSLLFAYRINSLPQTRALLRKTEFLQYSSLNVKIIQCHYFKGI